MAETVVQRSSAINRTPNNGSAPRAQLSGALPPVIVNMNGGGPKGAQGTVKQGVVLLPPKGARRTFTTGGLPNQPAKPGVVVTTPPRELRASAAVAAALPLSTDQLMLCRHLVDKYLSDQSASVEEKPTETAATNIKLAEATLTGIDAAMAALTAEAAAVAAEVAADAAAEAAAKAAALAPRAIAAGGRSVQGAATAAPRRVARPAQPLAPVKVKMDGGAPVIDDAPDNTPSAA